MITQAELDAKASTKTELWRLLQCEAGLYLSSKDTMTVSTDRFMTPNFSI